MQFLLTTAGEFYRKESEARHIDFLRTCGFTFAKYADPLTGSSTLMRRNERTVTLALETLEDLAAFQVGCGAELLLTHWEETPVLVIIDGIWE